MRRLLPDELPVDLDDVYADVELPDGRWVALGMVTSVDGAIAVAGSSRPLGGPGDQAAYRAVRGLADVVLVGASTAVSERYRPTWSAGDPDARAARGQSPLPVLAIVSGSGALPADAPAFSDAERPPLVVTSQDGAARLRATVPAAEPVEVPLVAGRLDLRAALDELERRGLRRVVCEGGPTLNHALLEQDLVDELLVTIAPWLVGTDPDGGLGLAGLLLGEGPLPMELVELRVHGSELVCRYRLLRRTDVTEEPAP